MSAMNRAAVNDDAATRIGEMDVSSFSRAECAVLLGKLIERLLTSDERGTANEANEAVKSSGDKLLTVEQTALALGVSRQWIYRNARKCGLAVELGKGTLRYSHAAIQRFISEKRVQGASKSHARNGKKAA